MFTDRFIMVPVELYSINAELIGYNEDSKTNTVLVRINPLDISIYREYSEGGLLTGETTVILKNGENFIIHMPINEFENLLNHFNK